ncbi:MAG: hypothetical protein Q8O89_00250, partial [Nanoarchaeota archaeon]|nr:hypothetical protein [Nanoarchaeota archaeon]
MSKNLNRENSNDKDSEYENSNDKETSEDSETSEIDSNKDSENDYEDESESVSEDDDVNSSEDEDVYSKPEEKTEEAEAVSKNEPNSSNKNVDYNKHKNNSHQEAHDKRHGSHESNQEKNVKREHVHAKHEEHHVKHSEEHEKVYEHKHHKVHDRADVQEEEFYSFKVVPKKLSLIVLGILVVIMLIFSFIYLNKKYDEQKTAKEFAEKNRLSKVNFIAISNSLCTDCFNIDDVLVDLRINYNVTKEEKIDYSESRAKDFINKYQITKLPVVIISGEVDRIGSLQGFKKVDDALVFTETPAPYTEAASGDILGMVSVVVLEDPSCSDCTNLSLAVDQMKTIAKISSEQ